MFVLLSSSSGIVLLLTTPSSLFFFSFFFFTDTPTTELYTLSLHDALPIFIREFGASKLEQRMVLDAGSRVLRFETEVDWQDHPRSEEHTSELQSRSDLVCRLLLEKKKKKKKKKKTKTKKKANRRRKKIVSQ